MQFRYQRELEPPDPSEGFSRIEVVPFERRRDAAFANKRWCSSGATACCAAAVPARDARLGRRCRSAAGRGEVLRRYQDDGWRLLGLSWQPEIADETMSVTEVEAGFARMRGASRRRRSRSSTARTRRAADLLVPEAAARPRRRAHQRHQLDPAQCIYVGPARRIPASRAGSGFSFDRPTISSGTL